jgi:hypothetical protein
MRKVWVWALALAFLSVFHWEQNWTHTKWTALLLILGFVMAWIIWKNIHWLVATLYYTTFVNAAMLGGWKFSRLTQVSWTESVVWERVVLHTLVFLALIPLPYLCLNHREIKSLGKVFMAWALVSAVLTPLQLAMGYLPTGFVGNPSMNGYLMVMVSPFLLRRDVILYLALAPAIFLLGATQPVVLYILVFLLHMVLVKGKRLFWVAPLLASFVYLGPLHFWSENFASDSGRFLIWKKMWEWWRTQDFLWWGYGPGGSQIIIPFVQLQNVKVFPNDFWLWLHNDWMQVLFEQGVVGLSLLGLTYLLGLYYARRQPHLFISWVVLGVGAIANYPLRSALHAVFAGWLLVRIFQEKTCFNKKLVYKGEVDDDFQ